MNILRKRKKQLSNKKNGKLSSKDVIPAKAGIQN